MISYGLRSLIIKMFANSKSVSIMVNSNRKKSFWLDGSNYAGYREYTIDKLLEAIEITLFDTHIQSMAVFSNIYLEYLWVAMYHHLLLPIYTYHGVNIAI